jgi:hypothetical protein
MKYFDKTRNSFVVEIEKEKWGLGILEKEIGIT